MWFAPVLISSVQSSHAGASSLALLLTSTVYAASAGIEPLTDSTHTLMGPSASMGWARVTAALVTRLVKVRLWVVPDAPSWAVMDRVWEPLSTFMKSAPSSSKLYASPSWAAKVRRVTPSTASVTLTGSPSSSATE